MTATPSRIRQKLKPGAVVRCRTRRYLVEDVQAPLDVVSHHVDQQSSSLSRC